MLALVLLVVVWKLCSAWEAASLAEVRKRRREIRTFRLMPIRDLRAVADADVASLVSRRNDSGGR